MAPRPRRARVSTDPPRSARPCVRRRRRAVARLDRAGRATATSPAHSARARVDAVTDELVQEEGVAGARLPQEVQRPPSTDPSSTVVAMVSTSVRASACSSMSAAGPSFHSATIESGAGSPLRSVNTTDAAPFVTSRWTSAAEASSSRCVVDTEKQSPVAFTCWSARDDRTQRCIAPATDRSVGTRCATAPSGPRPRHVSRRPIPFGRAPARPWRRPRGRRVFPTPAAPVSTTLPLAESGGSRGRSRRHGRPGASGSDPEHHRRVVRDFINRPPPRRASSAAADTFAVASSIKAGSAVGIDAQARRDVLRSDVLGEPRHDPLVRRRQPEGGLVTVHTSRMTDGTPVVSRRLMTPRTAPAGREKPKKAPGWRPCGRALRWAWRAGAMDTLQVPT